MTPVIQDRWLKAAFVTLTLAGILPIWIAEYLPLLDLPNHLAAVAVWHYHDVPRWHFKEYYDLNLVPLPYWAHYYTVHLLTYLTRNVAIANKLFLTAYAIVLPLGALTLTRRFGRSPWLALFTFPLVWNFSLADGFIAYCAGFAVVPLALALVDRHCQQPTLKRALAVIAVGSSIYFFHLLAYVLFLVCAGLLVLPRRDALRPRLLIARAVPILSCTLIGLWAFKRANRMNFHRVTGVGRELIYDSLPARLQQIPDRLINFVPGSFDEWVVVILVAAWLALAVTAARRARSDEDDAPDWLHSWGIELCFAGALALYLFSPRSMQRPFYWHMINGRFVVAVAFFAALTLRGRIDGWRRWLLLPVVVMSLGYDFTLCRAFRQFNAHAAGFDQIVSEVPRDKSVLTLILRPMGDESVNVSAFNQFPANVQIRHGGYNHYNFAEGFPLKYRMYIPAPSWSHAEEFNWQVHGHYWDYFLTFREGWQFSPLNGPFQDGKVRLVDARGPWRLYENLAKDDYRGEPPPPTRDP